MLRAGGHSPWFARPPEKGAPRRVFCFSFAGGNASTYRSWQALAGARAEICAIQLPGRADRLLEQPLEALADVVGAVAREINLLDPAPFVVFGHSLGALLAFELARLLQSAGLPLPEHLFVSACDAPQRRRPLRRVHDLPADQLKSVLQEYAATPPAVLANDELMELVLPAVRADFRMALDYRYRKAELLRIPITVLAGCDEHDPDALEVTMWREETQRGFKVHWFKGGHFFILDHDRAIVDSVLGDWSAMAQSHAVTK